MISTQHRIAAGALVFGAAVASIACAIHRAGAAEPEAANAGIVATAPGWVDVAGGTRHLGARSDGIVEEVKVRAGDTVAADALLLRFDSRQARLDAELADLETQRARHQQEALSAQVRRARTQLARLQPLVNAQAEAADTLTEQQETLKGLQSQLALAEIDVRGAALRAQAAHDHLARLELRAPGPGRVLRVAVHPGEAVNSGAELLWFAAAGPLMVRAELDERLFGQVRAGMAAEVSPEYDAAKIYAAHVTRVAESVGPVRELPDVRAAAKDDRVVECDLQLDGAPPLLIGQRTLVRIRASADRAPAGK